MTRVSLYVPCYNGERYIARCIEGILAQTRPLDEVFIVDDGSTDASAEIIARYPVELVSHERNRGLSAARNTGVRAASGELVASLDADCVARPDWLETLLRCRGETGAVGVGGRLEETNTWELADRWRTAHMPQHWGQRRLVDPAFLFGNNNLFDKGELVAAGLYPEALRTNFEDVSMARALLARGCRLVYEPAAVVEHLRSDTVRSVLRANYAWRFFGYDQSTTLVNVARSCGRHLGRELTRYLWHDAKRLDARCAGLSVAAVAYALGRDVSYYWEHRGEPSLTDAGVDD